MEGRYKLLSEWARRNIEQYNAAISDAKRKCARRSATSSRRTGSAFKARTKIDSRADASDADPMYDQAVRLVVRERMASISFLQRRLEIGFSRAGKLIDMMQRDGIVGPPAGGAKSREILVPTDYFDGVDTQLR